MADRTPRVDVSHLRTNVSMMASAEPARCVAADCLLAEVGHFLRRMAHPRRHHLASGLLLDDGTTVLGLNVVSNLGPASVCAEQIALGQALAASTVPISIVLTLRATFDLGPVEVVTPCGRCRELLYEYAPLARVAVPRPASTDFTLLSIIDLLPVPFHRRRPESLGSSS
jgi:cytidine deaminase